LLGREREYTLSSLASLDNKALTFRAVLLRMRPVLTTEKQMPNQNKLFSVTLAPVAALLKHAEEISHLEGIRALLDWDMETYMPKSAESVRGDQFSAIAVAIHDKEANPRLEGILDDLDDIPDLLNDYDEALVRTMRRRHTIATLIPASLVSRTSQAITASVNEWGRAKEAKNFAVFCGPLERTLDLLRKRAEILQRGTNRKLYDVFIDDYEPGGTQAQFDPIFDALKATVRGALERIEQSRVRASDAALRSLRPHKSLLDPFIRTVLSAMGFDFERGRLDESRHPFMCGSHPNDIRITTRYTEPNFIEPIASAMHEAGHGLYGQGHDTRLSPGLLSEGASMALHESQSRFWENQVGKSQTFWSYWLPILRRHAPNCDLIITNERHLVSMLRAVRRNPIRLDSDELTYNLHIALRYEIERDLVAGRIPITDLPRIWNERVFNYLGIEVKNDAEGVLQDTHWGSGLVGYFPTYSIGNLMAAQIMYAMEWDITPPVDNPERVPEWMLSMREWLRTRIHAHGRTYSPEETLERATGEALNPQHFDRYVRENFG
jgi:carboxypeptidase Taq